MAHNYWPELLAPDVAWQKLVDRWQLAAPSSELVSLPDALGRVLYGDVVAPHDVPPFTRSAVDGYAVIAADCGAAAPAAQVALRYVGEVSMGVAATRALHSGEAIWVATGSMLPEAADAVVMVEQTSRAGEVVRLEAPAALGDNVVPRGADVLTGQLVLRSGHRLRPQDIAALASLGIGSPRVIRRPQVAILVSGDELREPGEALGLGQIYNANGYALMAQVTAAGGAALPPVHVRDQLDAVVEALSVACATAPLVLLSGGSSVGVKDLTIAALEQLPGSTIVVHGVNTRPAKPTILALVEQSTGGQSVVIGIPGNPVSAMVSFDMFGQRVIERLTGQVTRTVRVPARLGYSVPAPGGRTTYLRVRLEETATGWLAHPVAGSSAIISSMVGADGIVTIPGDSAALPEGTLLAVRLF